MGGTIATLAAARRPELFLGLILLDPVFYLDRFIWRSRLVPRRRLRKMPMIRRALSRPERFASHDDAFSFYREKRAFKALNDDALRDYVHASKCRTPEGDVQLRYSPAWEAAVYATAPLVRRSIKQLTMPTLGLRGRTSDVLFSEFLSHWGRWQPTAVLEEIQGGHLFPLENPSETAAAVNAYVFAD
jgi:pimeloyl-ACP methyl ester carboxylesterase